MCTLAQYTATPIREPSFIPSRVNLTIVYKNLISMKSKK